jgi:citrate synthase
VIIHTHRLYDPGYTNTAVAKSKICEIKGSKGELSYRGYDIVELVQNSTFLEVAYLLIYGKLPDTDQLKMWTENVMHHSFVHTDLLKLLGTFRYNAHPMSMLISFVAKDVNFSSFFASPLLQPILTGFVTLC